MSREPLAVIGIGQDGPSGLSAAARARIDAAEVLAGGRRHLDFFPHHSARRLVFDKDIPAVVDQVREAWLSHKVVVLASGDPFFYGIGRLLRNVFPSEEIVFFPNISSIALAFARIKEPWEDAAIVSLHGRPLRSLLPSLHSGTPKIALLTDGKNHPAIIAQLLIEAGFAEAYELWVCEDLDGPHERITHGFAKDLLGKTFSPLNIVVLRRKLATSGVLPIVGLPEHVFQFRGEGRGMITKREVRLLTLCQLELKPGEVLWDIGAGSGSVAVEAGRLCDRLRVYAIEKEPALLEANLASFGLPNVTAVAGEAPDILANLPDPDAVFLGGSGGKLKAILETLWEKLRPGGRLVLNCITLESMTSSWNWLTERGLTPEVMSVHISHSRPLGPLHCLEPEKPIFIVRARKS